MRPGVAPAALDSSVSMCIARAYFGLTLTTTSPKTSERPFESILTLTICLSEDVFFGILGSCVDVSLRCDNAALELNLTLGANKLAGTAARNVAALSYGSGHAYRTGIGERKLNLILGTHGAKNGDRREAALRADNGNALVARELAGLRELLLDGQLIALAEEDIKSFSGDMYMARGSFNKNFLFHFKYPSFLICLKIQFEAGVFLPQNSHFV